MLQQQQQLLNQLCIPVTAALVGCAVLCDQSIGSEDGPAGNGASTCCAEDNRRLANSTIRLPCSQVLVASDC
jgi:hypothetical protein